MHNEENQKQEQHSGSIANGEELTDHEFVFSESDNENKELSSDNKEFNALKTDCTILWWNGQYQKPNIDITKEKVYVTLGTNVQRIQLRHVPSGAIRYYTGGSYRIPNGTYVLSLWGSTYPHNNISACVQYE